jgi:hypothetical protein
MPGVLKRIEAVRDFRKASKSAPTRKLAATPTLYHVNVIPQQPFLVVPKVSSERREYVPIGFITPPVIPSDLVFVIENASPALFGLITSRMHMAWLRHVGGRLESRYRYSIGLVYNPFPWPVLSSSAETRLSQLAQAILDARANHSESTLADLYDPAAMPADLRKAHQTLDAAVDKLYRKERFSSDRERVEFLLARYERERAPLVVDAQPARRRRRQ